MLSQAHDGLRDSRVIPDRCSRKSSRVLASPCTDWTARSTSPLLLLLGEASRHNFAVPTILDGIAKSDNTRLPIRLEDDSLVPHEVKVGHLSPCRIRVRHTLRRHRVTPNAFTLAVPHDERWKCVVCSILRLPAEPKVHTDSRYLFCLLRLRVNFAMAQ